MPEKLNKYTGDNHSGPAHSSPYPVERLARPISLVDRARQIEAASASVSGRASAKLEEIARQIQQLQQRAQEVLLKAEQDLDIHRARCSFNKVAGRVYHLYRGADGVATTLSMLSPAELGGQGTSEYLGGFRLELDQSWTLVSAP